MSDRPPFPIRPGDVYSVGDPEFIGHVPIRNDLEVLGSDTPGRPIGWTMACYSGSEVYLLDESGKPILTPLTNRDDLKEGMRIYAPTLMGGVIATVVRDKGDDYEEGELCWETEYSFGDLDFATDDRGAWTTSVAINKRLLK